MNIIFTVDLVIPWRFANMAGDGGDGIFTVFVHLLQLLYFHYYYILYRGDFYSSDNYCCSPAVGFFGFGSGGGNGTAAVTTCNAGTNATSTHSGRRILEVDRPTTFTVHNATGQSCTLSIAAAAAPAHCIFCWEPPLQPAPMVISRRKFHIGFFCCDLKRLCFI